MKEKDTFPVRGKALYKNRCKLYWTSFPSSSNSYTVSNRKSTDWICSDFCLKLNWLQSKAGINHNPSHISTVADQYHISCWSQLNWFPNSDFIWSLGSSSGTSHGSTIKKNIISGQWKWFWHDYLVGRNTIYRIKKKNEKRKIQLHFTKKEEEEEEANSNN